jgi:hypothetical protein
VPYKRDNTDLMVEAAAAKILLCAGLDLHVLQVIISHWRKVDLQANRWRLAHKIKY